MPPKKEKKAPLSPEEKKVRAAERKAQRKREAEEDRLKARRDELAREVEMSQSYLAKGLKKWYNTNYEARFPILKRDMEIAWQSFEHSLDLKDFIISELMDRMDETRIQEAMSWQDYIIRVDKLIGHYQKQIDCLEAEYQKDLTNLLGRANATRRLLNESHEDLEDYYKTILYIMEEKFNEASTMAQGEFMTKRDEETKKGTHEVEMMTANLEKTLQTTVGEIKNILDRYKESTESRRKEIEELRTKDDYYLLMIKRQESRMVKLSDEMTNLQNQINEKYEMRIELDDLKKDREETYTEYKGVRNKLSQDAALDDRQLLTLTTESNHVIKRLESILEKGDKILRLGAACRRLETQEEKVLPIGIPIKIDSEYKDLEKDPFAIFWKRYAHVSFIKRKLQPTLEDLYAENDMLKEQLKTVFEIMASKRDIV